MNAIYSRLYSRQYLWQQRKIEQGLCRQCGRNPIHGASYCRKCLRKKREEYRRKALLKRYAPKPKARKGRRA